MSFLYRLIMFQTFAVILVMLYVIKVTEHLD